MLKGYFKIAWRNLWKNKLFSLINIGGLAIGIASSLLLLSYVGFQLSYDNFHTGSENIYRVELDLYQNNKVIFKSAENYSAVGPALKSDYPEVLDEARLYNMGYKNNCVFTYDNIYLKETKFLYATASFLTMFSFPLIEGDPKTALVEPYTAVISASFSKKFFGSQNPVGKFIKMDDDDLNSELCKITGVCKDVPDNSHIKFNVLISYATLHNRRRGVARFENNWSRKDFYTYISLRPGIDPAQFEKKLSSFTDRHIPGEKIEHLESKLVLQPLKKIHLDSNLSDEAEVNGNMKTVVFLIIIAIFIISIAWVNFINLSTASSIGRSKEIGIRKVLGSERAQLIRQFLAESLCVNVLSFIVAVILATLLKPLFSRFFGVDFPLLDFFTNQYGLIFIFFIALGSFFSGLYPALVLSSFNPAIVLKGKMKTSKKSLALRRSLVVFQFSLSIFLIIGTIIVYQQVRYMRDQDLGLKVSQVLVMDRPGHWHKSDSANTELLHRFKETIKESPAVEAIGMSDAIPGKEIRWQLDYARKNASENKKPISLSSIGIDDAYLDILGMKILAGRNFSIQYKTDMSGLIITESAAHLLGFQKIQDAIGKQIWQDTATFTVVGVVNDFHQQSLQKKAEPVVFQFNGDDYTANEYYFIKLKTADVHRTIDFIQDTWNNVFAGNPFGFIFLDEYFNRQYKNDIQFGLFFGFFSLVAIAIACIGLVALVAFMIEQRIKEIGVRKILGADMSDIMLLLTKDFIKLVLLANLIAWPLGWLLMDNWLKDFAYRIHIHLLVFLLAGVTAVIITLVTISFQAIKAALRNPIKSLRTE